MQILRTFILKTDEELIEFQTMTQKAIGVNFPISYLKQSLVRGFRDSKNQLLAGYALVHSGKLRTIESMPDSHQINYDTSTFLEVTALSIDKNIKSGLFSGQFWIHFSKDIFLFKDKEYIIYAYDLKATKLQELYSLADPILLYKGQVKKLKGNAEASFEAIEIAYKRRINFLPVYVLPKFLKKIMFKRQTFIKDLLTLSFIRGLR